MFDQCLFTGTIVHPSNQAVPPPTAPLTIGLYVDDFICFTKDPEVERRSKQLLADLITVEFMVTIDWFLGTHFQWLYSNDAVSVHLSQTGFAAHLISPTMLTQDT